jgi:hypothetical protein
MSIEREFIEAVAEGDIDTFGQRHFGIRSSTAFANPYAEIGFCKGLAIRVLAKDEAFELPRCKTCKWQSKPSTPNIHKRHVCTCESVLWCAEFEPHDEFGCVHHEKREEGATTSQSTWALHTTTERTIAELVATGELFKASQVEKLQAVAKAAVAFVQARSPACFHACRVPLETALKAAGYEPEMKP